jgi:hypothetical protein
VKANVRKRAFALSTIKRAVGVPCSFALLFFTACPAADNQTPNLVFAEIVLFLGVCGWFFVLFSVLRGLRAGVSFGMGLAAVSLLPLLAYACVLVFAWCALPHP